MTNLREKIKKILNELYFEAHEVGVQKIMPRNEISIEKTTDQILQAFRDCLPKEDTKRYGLPTIDNENRGFSFCLAQIRERIREK